MNMNQQHKDEKLNKAMERYSASDFKEFIEQLELKRIDLVKIEAQSKLEPTEIPEGISLKMNYSAELIKSESDSKPIIIKTFDLIGTQGRKHLIKISASWRIVFYSPEIPMDIDLFTLFDKYNLTMMIYPYFRETVQTTIAKMNLPNLTIPMIKKQ